MNNGKICVSVCAETADEVIAKIKRAEAFTDVTEIRFDCLAESEIDLLLGNLPQVKEYLFTFRPKDQGGKREITLGERVRFWADVITNCKINFMIDVEYDPSLLRAIDPTRIDRIVSHHELDHVAENVDVIWEAMLSLTNGIIKIAVQADNIVDAIPVWNLLDRAKAARRNVIPIAMGEAGKWTRILGLAHGAFMTYGSLDKGDETAPGQLTAKDLIETYRVKELDQETAVYGVIGNPVTRSLSPYIHNSAFASAGFNSVFVPLMVKVLGAFMTRMVKPKTREVELNFRGFAVTMPHKQAIIQYLDEIDSTAAAIGAANTVKIDEDGRSIGYNTDAYGFIEPLKRHIGDLSDKRAAILGAGGAARACVYALNKEGCDVTVFARDGDKARSLADEFGVRSQMLTEWQTNNFDIVVNATPAGMSGVSENDTLLTAAQLKGVRFVYDLVTSPKDTPLIREAKAAGIEVIGGIEMLIAQAAKQFEIWTGQPADVELMRASTLKHFR